MNYNTIVIAGTKDSREVIEAQLKEGKKLLACVATDLGAEMLEEYGIDIHVGRLDLDGFLHLFRENPCDKIIDASHPFAKVVTDTVIKAAEELGIPYERYERNHLIYDYERIISVADTEEAIAVLNTMEGNVFLTTGVNTCGAYQNGVTDAKNRVYVRVLDNAASYEGCEKAGYDKEHVFGEMPPYTVEDNLRLLRKTQAVVMVSKDSGATGGVDVKVNACKEAGIPMVLIRRPQ